MNQPQYGQPLAASMNPMPYAQSQQALNQPQYTQPQQPINQMSYAPPAQFNSTGLPTPPPAVSMLEHSDKKKQKGSDSSDQNNKSEKTTTTGDYFALLKRFSADSAARWRNLPVRIHLPANSPASWQRSLDVGIKRWGDHLPLKVVPLTEPADLEVSWVNKLVPQYLGITRLVFTPAQMQIQIYLLRPTFYLPEIPEKVLANVFLHELGHGLGIFGHSDSKQDLMYGAEVIAGSNGKPAEIHYAGLSDRDINTLRHIYTLPPLPEGFTTPQPYEWGYR
jgi:predicted Zn-dependent protease